MCGGVNATSATGKKVITRVLGLTYAPCMDTMGNLCVEWHVVPVLLFIFPVSRPQIFLLIRLV